MGQRKVSASRHEVTVRTTARVIVARVKAFTLVSREAPPVGEVEGGGEGERRGRGVENAGNRVRLARE